MKKKIFTFLTLLLCLCSGAWADSQTIKSGTVSSGDFTYSDLTEYTYSSGYWASGDNDVIKIEKGSFTFVNAGGVTITGITVNGVNEDNDNSKNATITVSDGVNTATTGSVSWVSRKSTTPSSHAMTGVSGLTMTANTTYTVNVADADKKMFITLDITYTTGGGGGGSTSYTVTYNANGGTGAAMADSEGASITLSANTYTAPSGYSFDGWNTAANGSGTAYTAEQSGITANLDLYAQWKQTVTLDDNGGTEDGSVVAHYNGTLGAVTAPTYAGHSVTGYYDDAEGTTKVLNADGSFAASNVTGYITGSVWTKTGATTLYAQWEEVVYDYTFTPATSGTNPSAGDEINTSTGGTMTMDGGTIKYTSSGLSFESNGSSVVTVTLNKIMQVGTVIRGTLYYSNGNNGRGLYIRNTGGTNKATWSFDGDGTDKEFSYTVVAGDGLAGSNVFKVARYSNVYLKSLTVENCATSYSVGSTLSNVTKTSGAIVTLPNTEYTAVYSANSGYALPDDITVTIDGKTATKNTDYTWNQYSGKVTIAAASVTGNIVIAVTGETYVAPTSGILFNMVVDNVTSDYSLPSKTEVNLSSYATITNGDAILGNKSNQDGKASIDDGGGNTVCFAGSDAYLILTFKHPLKTGDIISFVNGAGSEQISFTTTNSRATTYSTTSNSYVVGETFNGVKTIYVWRFNGTAYLHSLTIKRSETVTTKIAEDKLRTYATHVTTGALDFSSVEAQVEAYIATGLNGTGNAVVISKVSQVPANTPIIIKTASQGATVEVPTTASADAIVGNLLVAGDGTTAWNGTANTTYYYIASDEFHEATSGTLQSGKAYLAIATGAARTLSIEFNDDLTGISEIRGEKEGLNGDFFDLQGRKVAQPTKGLYIVNGKKVVIK